MINQVTLIGRVVENPILRKYEEVIASTITLAVARPFKNMEGNVETDFIRVSLWNGVAQSTCEYIQKGDIVGIKGRLAVKESEVSFSKDTETLRKKILTLELIGERVIFIHTNKKRLETEGQNG
ncbi:MAG: single-stranded DNA-binding protein [Anaeroplasma bactoclasticum]|nr:single-stranded DNA-binding protein [Anaeroplasma bactoclasticum]